MEGQHNIKDLMYQISKVKKNEKKNHKEKVRYFDTIIESSEKNTDNFLEQFNSNDSFVDNSERKTEYFPEQFNYNDSFVKNPERKTEYFPEQFNYNRTYNPSIENAERKIVYLSEQLDEIKARNSLIEGIMKDMQEKIKSHERLIYSLYHKIDENLNNVITTNVLSNIDLIYEKYSKLCGIDLKILKQNNYYNNKYKSTLCNNAKCNRGKELCNFAHSYEEMQIINEMKKELNNIQ